MKADTRKGSSKVEVTCRKVSPKLGTICILMALSSHKDLPGPLLFDESGSARPKKTHKYRFCAL